MMCFHRLAQGAGALAQLLALAQGAGALAQLLAHTNLVWCTKYITENISVTRSPFLVILSLRF